MKAHAHSIMESKTELYTVIGNAIAVSLLFLEAVVLLIVIVVVVNSQLDVAVPSCDFVF